MCASQASTSVPPRSGEEHRSFVVAEWAWPSAHTKQAGKLAANEQKKISGSDLLYPAAKQVFIHSGGTTPLPA